MNDMAERTVPMQGGVCFMVEWDHTKQTNTTVGEVYVSTVHPKQFAPQPGIYTGIDDMDWFIVICEMGTYHTRREIWFPTMAEAEAWAIERIDEHRPGELFKLIDIIRKP